MSPRYTVATPWQQHMIGAQGNLVLCAFLFLIPICLVFWYDIHSSKLHEHIVSMTTTSNESKSGIVITSHAEASASNSVQLGIDINVKMTAQVHAVFYMSDEVAACNAIRIHEMCCEMALPKAGSVTPLSLSCHELYLPYYRMQNASSSASKGKPSNVDYGHQSNSSGSANFGYTSGGSSTHSGTPSARDRIFEPCNDAKHTGKICCKACTPECMSCDRGVPIDVYRLCYRRQPNGCHRKCRPHGAPIGSGLCRLASN